MTDITPKSTIDRLLDDLECLAAWKEDLGARIRRAEICQHSSVGLSDEPIDQTIRRLTELGRHCLSCAENAAEVRRCAIIDCPLWPYRMGRNPHNPKRGTNPFNGSEKGAA